MLKIIRSSNVSKYKIENNNIKVFKFDISIISSVKLIKKPRKSKDQNLSKF